MDEYRSRHDAIWPERAALLNASGIYDYSVFLDADARRLFAVSKRHPVMRRWWDHMADLMEVEPGRRPQEGALSQVFYLA